MAVTLEHSHASEDIAKRLQLAKRSSLLRDSIYGAIDGAVTTFAVIAGVAGAGLSPATIIILGIANLIADGFSMAAANFLGTRAEGQQVDRLRAIERKHIALCPEGETEEVRQILSSQGYAGELLEATVSHITSDEDHWIDTMLQFEYGVSTERSNPLASALATFLSFLVVGFVPLSPYCLNWFVESNTSMFPISTLLTACAFFAVGALKSRFVDQNWFWSACETLAVGAVAAGLAYYAGYLLGGIESQTPANG